MKNYFAIPADIIHSVINNRGLIAFAGGQSAIRFATAKAAAERLARTHARERAAVAVVRAGRTGEFYIAKREWAQQVAC